MESSFIHLHNHSEFSILDGDLKTASLVEAAYQNKMPAVALREKGQAYTWLRTIYCSSKSDR